MQNFINSKKGFTLVELIATLGVIISLCGFIIISIAVIPQMKMKKNAEIFKSNFTLTKDFAKSHGGEAELKIIKTKKGIVLIREGKNIKSETITLSDNKLELFYLLTNNQTQEYQLGKQDPSTVCKETYEGTICKALVFKFAQTSGDILGPDLVDYIILSNGSKNYKLIIKQVGGLIYYDYDIPKDVDTKNAVKSGTVIQVESPCFIKDDGSFTKENLIYEKRMKNGEPISIQPCLNYDSRYIKISGEYRAVNPGKYIIEFKLKDPYSTVWKDTMNGTAIKKLIWTIE